MNKFVKGAKNLAFALSFVTVAACGNVKKVDLDALEKKINDKFEGRADGRTVNDDQSYVRKGELKKVSDEVEGKIDGEIQKIKTEVLTQIAGDKKDVLFGVLNTNLSNLGNVARVKGCEKVLDGFTFNGKFAIASDVCKVEGKVENGGFKKEFSDGSGAECDDGFFVNFVKCGGIVEITGLDKVVFTSGASADRQIKVGGKDVSVANLVKFLGFLKVCNLLEKAKGLNLKGCFGTSKRFSLIDADLDRDTSISIIKAVCDEGSFDENKVTWGENTVDVAFKINGTDCSWKIVGK